MNANLSMLKDLSVKRFKSIARIIVKHFYDVQFDDDFNTDMKLAEKWFKYIEWLTLISLFKFVSLITSSLVIDLITNISYYLLFDYLLINFLRLFRDRYKFSKLYSIIGTLFVIIPSYFFTIKIVEEISGKS